MTLHDKQPIPENPHVVDESVQPKCANSIGVFDDALDDVGQQQVQADAAIASSSAAMPSDVPQTPDVFAQVPSTPRQAAPTGPHGEEVEDQEAKRARVETSKKQRLERISAENQAMIRTVKFGDETLHTMDEYAYGRPWASESGLFSTMAMSISSPSFLMRVVLPSCILFKIATPLFSHTIRSQPHLHVAHLCLSMGKKSWPFRWQIAFLLDGIL